MLFIFFFFLGGGGRELRDIFSFSSFSNYLVLV